MPLPPAHAPFISRSPDQTAAFGRDLGDAFHRRAFPETIRLVLLRGDLGAGKTLFTSGFATGLQITADVHSPSYTVMNMYAGADLKLFHLDLYRLSYFEEVVDTGLFEYLADRNLCIIEWSERIPELATYPHLEICFTSVSESTREITWHLREGGLR
jgi:tRNA threonylcarbamoyladenosine biosynthesis protein TsaE